MDGAASRVELRGLRLLRRCRELRSEADAREVARRRRDAELAAAEAGRALANLQTHRDAWRAQERALMKADPESAIPAWQLVDRRRHLERLADEAVRLADTHEAAEAASARAAGVLDSARALLAARHRETCKAAEAVGRAERRVRRSAVAAELREAEDETADRVAIRRAIPGQGRLP